MRRAGFAAAGDERQVVPALNPHGVLGSPHLVGDEIEAGFVTTYALRLFAEMLGCALELLAALNLNHLVALRFNL